MKQLTIPERLKVYLKAECLFGIFVLPYNLYPRTDAGVYVGYGYINLMKYFIGHGMTNFCRLTAGKYVSVCPRLNYVSPLGAVIRYQRLFTDKRSVFKVVILGGSE